MYTPRRLESELELGSLSSASLNRFSREEEEEDLLSPGSSILAARAFYQINAIHIKHKSFLSVAPRSIKDSHHNKPASVCQAAAGAGR